MHFPLDILTNCLSEQGVEIVKAPAHPKNEFDWVTSVSDFLRAPAGQIIVPVFDGISSSTSLTPKIVAIRSRADEAAAEALAPDDILVRTSLPVALLADRVQRFLFQIIQWNDKMAEMVDAGCISMDLLKESEGMLGAYVGLSDATFSYIAHTPDIPPLDDVSAYFVEHGNYPLEAIQRTRERGLMKRWENQDWTVAHTRPNEIIPYPTVSRVVKRHGAYAAHLLLVSEKAPSASTRFLFDLLAAKVEHCLRRHWRMENPLDQGHAYFLEALYKGNIYGADQLAEHAELHGIPTSGSFQVCVAGSAWKVGSCDYLAKRLLEREPRCKMVIQDDQVVMLLCAAADDGELLDEMERNLFETARLMNVEIGASERVGELALASLALEAAKLALHYGSLHSSRYIPLDEGTPQEAFTHTAFRFRRYFPYCALDQFEQHSKFITRLLSTSNPLARLQEADRKRNSNDLEILRTYLYLEGKVNAVCNKLHMHRNTVLYRLEKIRAIVSADLDDSDVRQYLRTLFFLMT